MSRPHPTQVRLNGQLVALSMFRESNGNVEFRTVRTWGSAITGTHELPGWGWVRVYSVTVGGTEGILFKGQAASRPDDD